MHLIAEPVLFVLVLTPIVGVALVANRSRRFALAALFLFLLAFDYVVTTLLIAYDVLALPGADWNWTGKVFSLTWAFLFLRFGPLTSRDVGLTLKQRSGSVVPAFVITSAIVVVSMASGAALAGDMAYSIETLLYHLTMPGFAEELAYRGIFLALLHRALSAGREGPVHWWPAIITTLAFGFAHGLALDGWAITFSSVDFVLSLLAAAAFVWLRELTGSLVFPMLGHNVSNTALYLMGML